MLAMGWKSYKYDDLPVAFIEKGASAYLGWSTVVTLEYVDKVTLDPLGKLCSNNLTLAQGIARTMADMGKDPYFDAHLKLYPVDSGDRTIKELIR